MRELIQEQHMARQILQNLSQGRDPFTGEELPPDALVNNEDVRRALLVGAEAVETATERKRHLHLYANVGSRWTESEDNELITSFQAGLSLEEIAVAHRRSITGIEARLEKLGFITQEQRVTKHWWDTDGEFA